MCKKISGKQIMGDIMNDQNSYGEIWKTLSGVNVQEQVRKKGDLNYLPWSFAWSSLMEHYPNSDFDFKKPIFFEDGSCELWVKVTINNCTRKIWLPVMNYKGQPVINPNAVDINKTRMRALVKCIGLFGLGLYIYKGEDLPELRGQTTGALLDFDTIKKAWQFFKAKIDDDADDFDYQAMQDAATNLSNMNPDYMIEVMNMFGKSKPEDSNRQYKNLLADALKKPLDENGKPLPDEAA